ncbi:hypothetical protein ACIRYZ_13910 [Kitasatospora sp. NPDC101155]|uniref:hypothetical protein n=1 Tax=Kitasatospora sp. NPDC101155 TaxID=3364097 RepID=UPI0037FA8A78
MDVRRISGVDAKGRQHVVRIAQGRDEVQRVECDSCGHRERAELFARQKAQEHLWGTHHVQNSDAQGSGPRGSRSRGFDEEYGPLGIARWVVAGTLGLVLLIVLLSRCGR